MTLPLSDHRPGLRIRVAPEALTIRVWPLRDRPLTSLGLLAVLIAAGLIVGWASPTPLYGWGTLLALGITTWRTWIPVRFELNSTGVQQNLFWSQQCIPWSAIQQCEVYREGVLLLPEAMVNGLSPLRGLYLPWGTQRAELLGSLEYHLRSLIPGPRSTAQQKVELQGPNEGS